MTAPKSPHEMFQVMKTNIAEKTGKSMDHWVALARESKITKFKALTDHMKHEHGMTHGYAQLVAWAVIDPKRLERGNEDQEMVDELYAGDRETLRPIYDTLIARGRGLGKDIDLVICKTYSSLRARSQFAIIVPRTRKAVDLELAMPPDTGTSGRLESIKNSNPRFTHRIRISNPDDVDQEVTSAIEAAWKHNVG